jgi:hypothetical protein
MEVQRRYQCVNGLYTRDTARVVVYYQCRTRSGPCKQQRSVIKRITAPRRMYRTELTLPNRITRIIQTTLMPE